MIVLDASVAIKWYVKEKGSDEAEKLLVGERRPVAPELIRTEVNTAIRNQLGLSGHPKDSIDLLCERWARDLREMSVRLFENGPLMQPAWNMAQEFRHSIYDCIYLALAEELGVPLVTANGTFIKKVRKQFPRAMLLPGTKVD